MSGQTTSPVAFIAKVKMILGVKAKGRHVLKGAEGYHLREEAAPYNPFFRAEKNDIGPENTYFCTNRVKRDLERYFMKQRAEIEWSARDHKIRLS